jgi:DNA polymerase-3 subunit delta'
MVVSPEKGAIKIEQVRRMCQALSYPPYESPIRVILLEDVHGMRMEAANCLLKTLEEPPPDNLLILTADSAKEVLSTIISRCQLIPFYNLTLDETVEVLLECETGLDRETAELMARLAEGSPGKAMLYWKTEMMAVMKYLAGILSNPSLDFDGDAGVLLQAAEMMSDLKENLPWLFGLLRIWLRDRLMAVSDLPERAGTHDGDGTPEVERVKSWSSRRLFGTLKAIDVAERQLARNCNRTLVCEVLLFSLCSPNNSFAETASI